VEIYRRHDSLPVKGPVEGGDEEVKVLTFGTPSITFAWVFSISALISLSAIGVSSVAASGLSLMVSCCANILLLPVWWLLTSGDLEDPEELRRE